ncbi:MAG: TetR/AcrR family transcriptional repressor of nem operon [Myxococcota bacterium]
MGRPKGYCRNELLQQAMNAFWEHGYDSTSLSELVDCTGVNKVSLYREFGDKRGLYLACLDRYQNCVVAKFMEPLLAPEAGLQTLRDWFASASKGQCDSGYRTCMMANATVEGVEDPEVQRRTREHHLQMQAAFATVIRSAQARGEVDATHDADVLSGTLMAVAIGGSVIARSHQDPEACRRAVFKVLDLLAA